MKTRKIVICMATSALMSATFIACSNEGDFFEGNEVKQLEVDTPASTDNVMTLVATLENNVDPETRSVMTDNGTNVTTTWELGDKIWVNYDDTGDNNRVAKGTVSAVDGSGKATVTVDLVNPKNASIIVFGFPYDHWTEAKDVRIDQVGTLADINLNHSAISGSGTLTVVGSDVTLPTNVGMNQEMAIWKLNFDNGYTSITNVISSLNISFGVGDDYMITPNALDDIYVALYPVAGKNITITAATTTGLFYTYSKSGVTLANGKVYRSDVTMSAAVASSTYRIFTSRTAYTDEAIPGGATTVTSGTTTWGAGTYVVSGDVTINGNVSVVGNVKLILKDGAELTVNGTITGGYNLTIYGQELGTGKLTVNANDINVQVTNLYIHGGIINVPASQQGIEAQNIDIYHGKVTTAGDANGFMVLGDMHVYGGNVTCSAVHGGALSIYGAGTPGSLTVSGGTFTATAAGVGNCGIDATDGSGNGTASIVFTGGTIVVSGGASDNGNSGGHAIDVCGTLTISGTANVTANGGTDAFGQGGGYGINVRAGSSSGGSATISGGTVTATSGPGGMAAINTEGDLTISGATTQIDATGGDMGEGILAFGTITINGGTVTATAGENAIGLEGITTISGGIVTAIGGAAIASSDGDGFAGFDGGLTITGGRLIATGGAGDGTGADGLGISVGSTIALTGVTMYEGDTANPATPAASQTACTKRYVKIQ